MWATLFAIWIIIGGARDPLQTPVWRPLIDFFGSQITLGCILLTGGILGILGLVLRSRWLSLASCAVCLIWCIWIAVCGFWSNLHGNANLGWWFALLAAGVFILRFWLLLIAPSPEESYGKGW